MALAIGEVMPGWAMTQATATRAGVLPVPAATSSRAARILRPRGLRYLPTVVLPRGLLAASAAVRYLPVRKPGRQRIEIDHADALVQAQLPQVLLELGAVAEVVQRLQALVARQTRACG